VSKPHVLTRVLTEYAALLPAERAAYRERLLALAEKYKLTREEVERRLDAIDAARVVKVVPHGD
jgi:hypothetical protein